MLPLRAGVFVAGICSHAAPSQAQISPRKVSLPPLIKGYLRLGAYIGDGAVLDRQFGTTDVLIILPVEKIDPRYFEHFGTPDEVKSRIAQDA